MKKLSTYLFLILFSFSASSFADDKKKLKVLKDYSFDLNDNIINFGWKIKSKRNTSKYGYLHFNQKFLDSVLCG